MCTRVTELKTRGITIPTLCCIINDLCNLKSTTECNHYETYFTAPGLTEIKVISLHDRKQQTRCLSEFKTLLKCSSRALVGRRYGARADNKQTVDKLVDEDNHHGSGNGQGNLTFYVG